ncbi:MAG: DUF3472 domain-containing protein [Bacteroidota bacterium]
MRKIKRISQISILFIATTIFWGNNYVAQELDKVVKVPVGGNSWLVDSKANSQEMITQDGITNWQYSEDKFRIYFKITQIGELEIELNAKVISGESKIKCTINNQSSIVVIKGSEYERHLVGKFNFDKPGYYFIELEGIKKDGEKFADIKDIILSDTATRGELYYVKDEFYWGRRGPSVHLSFPVPDSIENVEWFYSEITVPKGEDVIGSYFMANGFAHGYFGIQVNSEKERRILFSVWSPYKTQNPAEIPEEYKIVLLKKGRNVYSGKFGNEGSGGQSYLKYNWKAGNKYRFLLRGKPEGNNHTVFTAYFYAPELDEWKLIASFRRPFTDSYLTRLYSFLENFYPETGNISRKAYYTNQWICDNRGDWNELTKAKFTADATARKEARLDYSGGLENNTFFMKNCGFFNERTKIDSWFTRKPNSKKPIINFKKLR